MLTPSIPIFMSGEEFNADFVPLPDMTPDLWGKGERGKGKWLYGAVVQWEQLKLKEKMEMLDDVKRMIKIRKQNPDYWVGFISEFLKLFPNEWDYVLIPDTRFPNEIQRMIDDGFSVFSVRVNRTDFESKLTYEQKNHISEIALDDYKFDYTINTISDLEVLKKKLKVMYEYMNIMGGDY
jgi:hypothetical protein